MAWRFNARSQAGDRLSPERTAEMRVKSNELKCVCPGCSATLPTDVKSETLMAARNGIPSAQLHQLLRNSSFGRPSVNYELRSCFSLGGSRTLQSLAVQLSLSELRMTELQEHMFLSLRMKSYCNQKRQQRYTEGA